MSAELCEWGGKFAPLYSYEFDSPDEPGSGELMDHELMEKLLAARKAAQIPFIINSGIRTPDHNRKVGGVSNSSHLSSRGYACDIAITNSRHRFIILKALIEAGLNRLGIYATFIHVDNDPDKPKEVAWYK